MITKSTWLKNLVRSPQSPSSLSVSINFPKLFQKFRSHSTALRSDSYETLSSFTGHLRAVKPLLASCQWCHLIRCWWCRLWWRGWCCERSVWGCDVWRVSAARLTGLCRYTVCSPPCQERSNRVRGAGGGLWYSLHPLNTSPMVCREIREFGLHFKLMNQLNFFLNAWNTWKI